MHGEGIENEGFHFGVYRACICVCVCISILVVVVEVVALYCNATLYGVRYLQRATGIRWRQITNSGDNLYSPEIAPKTDDQTSHHPSM